MVKNRCAESRLRGTDPTPNSNGRTPNACTNFARRNRTDYAGAIGVKNMRFFTAISASLFLVTAAIAAPPPPAGEGPMRVGVLVFAGFLTSEVSAPLEVFAKASSKGTLKFEVMTVAADKKTVTSEEGLRLQPDVDFANSPDLDILVVPSSLDVEGLMANQEVVGFIRQQGAKASYLASNCAGAFLLGEAGLLDGRRVTTYIGGNADLQKKFPKAKVIDGRHIVVDGNLVSSIGGVTTYDATLTMLQQITGPELANQVAEALYYFPWLERGTAGETR